MDKTRDSDSERKSLYTSLLRGLANEAQNRLCNADQQHAWGPWVRHQVQHDGPVRFDPSATVSNKVVHVRSERHCLNCGKEQHA